MGSPIAKIRESRDFRIAPPSAGRGTRFALAPGMKNETIHFYFPGEGGGDPLLAWARDRSRGAVRSLNVYLHVELAGRLGVTQTPAVVFVRDGRPVRLIQGRLGKQKVFQEPAGMLVK